MANLAIAKSTYLDARRLDLDTLKPRRLHLVDVFRVAKRSRDAAGPQLYTPLDLSRSLPAHHGPDGKLRFPYDRPEYRQAPALPDQGCPVGPPFTNP